MPFTMYWFPVTEADMSNDILKGKWSQAKGKAREQWGKLTDDDLDIAEGQREQLIGKIQERYGKSKAEAEREVDDWIASI